MGEKQRAIEFGEWLRTFELLLKQDKYWVLDCQISTEELYEGYLKDRERWLKNTNSKDNEK